MNDQDIGRQSNALSNLAVDLVGQAMPTQVFVKVR